MSKKTQINTISQLKNILKNYSDNTEISFLNNDNIKDLYVTIKSGIGFTREMEEETKLYFHDKETNF
jgi:hypothetical protein